MIAYVSCHDDLCLTDRLRASVPETKFDEEALIRLDLLAQTAVLTSQGVPFLLSGEEMLRTKQGVHNSFKSPDEINHLDWNNLQRYPQVFDYYKGLVHLRLSHPAFRLGSADLSTQAPGSPPHSGLPRGLPTEEPCWGRQVEQYLRHPQ